MVIKCRSVARRLFLILGSFILHFICIGIPTSFGILYNELSSAFELGDGEMGWIASLFRGLLFGSGKCIVLKILLNKNSMVLWRRHEELKKCTMFIWHIV